MSQDSPSSIDSALKMLHTEMDPTYSLLSADMVNTTSMYGLQKSTAVASEAVSTIAFNNVSAGDAILSADMAVVATAGSGEPAQQASTDMQRASSQFGYDTTLVNNTNNNFSNITQAGMTGVTDLTRQESNAMDSASAVIDNISGITSLLAGWGN